MILRANELFSDKNKKTETFNFFQSLDMLFAQKTTVISSDEICLEGFSCAYCKLDAIGMLLPSLQIGQ